MSRRENQKVLEREGEVFLSVSQSRSTVTARRGATLPDGGDSVELQHRVCVCVKGCTLTLKYERGD